MTCLLGVALGAAVQVCSSDVDGDGLINVNDLLSMLSQFGAEGSRPEDVNADNIVNVRRLPYERALRMRRVCALGPC